MSDIHIRKTGRTGRITLTRPDALNAITWDMVEALSAALPRFAADDDVTMLVIDGAGDRAFCAGGDIAGIYAALKAGDHGEVRRFWRAEYPLNLALFDFPKPVATFLQGFTMGGGVGIGCHGSHRVVGDTSRIAMPECTIGLVPDVGGSLLLARAPGRLGEYLGTTGARMGPGDAIHAGFADYYIPEAAWPDLIARLEETGDWNAIDAAAMPAPDSPLASEQPLVDTHFGGETLRDILTSLRGDETDWTHATLDRLARNAPLAMATAVQLIHRARTRDRMDEALRQEYRFAHRIVEMGDFQEGIRAAVIDKDRAPTWRHPAPDAPTPAEVSAMLMPLGPDDLTFQETPT
ncbi:enoyl-CoA hydratase/isomerase family protein [Alphaproteobacteria bacterium GH1-50]|uniref:3-hydroxyisobutyryl-CoA hydrolase n=1 Tax=Kangsaoukella pontilimi TaxID=2691042 RepID=A0A7C9IG64_9RHOB|nr:enoyl-CoA hydratase/isomerase family protein [Kangsaoukella pontilimi]MXQ07687.1 enoyl-CoA hydratase/isomerase family protein [Kangsaoukella pontilimi]